MRILPKYKLTFKPFGPRAILIEWPQKINEAILKDILSFIKLNINEELQDCIQAYCSLTLVYKHPIKSFTKEKRRLSSLYKTVEDRAIISSTLWEIPVCYDDEFGLDLKEIAKLTGLSKDEIITKHTSSEYLVYFIGFLPGFLYLGGLDEVLHTSRRKTPRLRVPKGSVAIGGSQTGVYPQGSSGGWNLIGKSPLNFFDIEKDAPCFAKSGDRVKFVSISKKAFQKIEKEVQEGTYKLKSVVV